MDNLDDVIIKANSLHACINLQATADYYSLILATVSKT